MHTAVSLARTDRKPSLVRFAVIAVLLAYTILAFYRISVPDLDGDEGRQGTSALNIIADHRQFAIVSPDPNGLPWSTWPYAYPTLLAGSILLFGKNELALRLVNVVLMALAALCIYTFTLSLLKGRVVAIVASSLFLLNVATLAYARSVMAEPSVVFWGCVALVAAAAYCESDRLFLSALCGVALGLGFLSKLWLILPFCAASALLLVFPSRPRSIARTFSATTIGTAFFVLTAVSHLLLVRLLAPEHFKTWIGIYFLHAAASRLGGAGYSPEMWYRPWWFYFGSLFKCLFFGLPLLPLGLTDLVRRRKFLVLAVLACLVGPALVLSLFKIKESAYIFQAYPALAVVMACGLQRFLESAPAFEIIIGTLGSIGLAAFFLSVGVLTKVQCLMMLALYFIYLLAAPTNLPWSTWRRAAAVAASFAALLFADVMVIQRQLQHRTHYREVAAYFKDKAIGWERPIVFTAPEFPAMGFYLFRQGEYWDTFYFHKDDAQFVHELECGDRLFYVVDPSGTLYGGRPKPEWKAALEENTRNVTADIERTAGTGLGLQVLVPAKESCR